MADTIRLRAASPADLALLHRWDEQPHVRASVPDKYWNWEIELERSPSWLEQLIAEVDDRPIGPHSAARRPLTSSESRSTWP